MIWTVSRAHEERVLQTSYPSLQKSNPCRTSLLRGYRTASFTQSLQGKTSGAMRLPLRLLQIAFLHILVRILYFFTEEMICYNGGSKMDET
jgi:hypothetical protein